MDRDIDITTDGQREGPIDRQIEYEFDHLKV